MPFDTPQYVTDLARKMRKGPTPEEAILWEAVRNNKLGVKFRNQHLPPPGETSWGASQVFRDFSIGLKTVEEGLDAARHRTWEKESGAFRLGNAE